MPKVPTTSDVPEKNKILLKMKMKRKRNKKGAVNQACTPSRSMSGQSIPIIDPNGELKKKIPEVKPPMYISSYTEACVDNMSNISTLVQNQTKFKHHFKTQIRDQGHSHKVPPLVRHIKYILPSSDETSTISETETRKDQQSTQSQLPATQSSDSGKSLDNTQMSQSDNQSKQPCQGQASQNTSSQCTNLQPTNQKSDAQINLANKKTLEASLQSRYRASNKLVTQYKSRNFNKNIRQTDFSHIFDSPLYINFETTKDVANSNDVETFNIENDRNSKVRLFKKNKFKKNKSFQMLSQVHAKELGTDIGLQDQKKADATENKLTTEKSQQDEKIKKLNNELREAIYSDIDKVVRDNIKTNMNKEINTSNNEQGALSQFVTLPLRLLKDLAGVPKSFILSHNNFGAIQPQIREDFESPDVLDSSQKRLSAFQRLGPLAQPKKPKLTINLNLHKEQAVREVVEVEPPKNTPVHDDEDIINSTDETVMKYLPFWPWKKTIGIRKSVTARTSKTVMMIEEEQMEKVYEKDNIFFMITLKGYPPTWTKEQLLDLLLEHLKDISFIPCFIEFNSSECKFLVIRCRGALLALHRAGLRVRRDAAEVRVTVAHTLLGVKQLDFLPRSVLRRLLALRQRGAGLDLGTFTLRKDLSHFIYFPLNRVANQSELLQSDVAWHLLTELNLSGNRIKTLEGFTLETTTPKLNTLDLSHNYIEKTTVLLGFRNLPLKKLYLEGNPLCTDFTEPDRYVKVMRTMFSTLRELDGVPLVLAGDMPKFKRNYCPEEAKEVAAKFLEIFFPLLELPHEDRKSIQPMYAEDAVLTITYRNKLRYEPSFKNARNLLLRSRVLIESDFDHIVGASNITKLIKKWPDMEHDPSSFAVDVIHHSESSTIMTINGILKLTTETLAEDETLVAFTRTVVLRTRRGFDYEIHNELLYWDKPTEESSKRAFQMLSVPRKTKLGLKFDSVPDDATKEGLIKIFMNLTDLDKTQSERCLEEKNWHIKDSLEYFIKLLKFDNI